MQVSSGGRGRARSGKCTWENPAAFACEVYEGIQSKKQTVAVTIDLKAAYNKVHSSCCWTCSGLQRCRHWAVNGQVVVPSSSCISPVATGQQWPRPPTEHKKLKTIQSNILLLCSYNIRWANITKGAVSNMMDINPWIQTAWICSGLQWYMGWRRSVLSLPGG